MRHNNNSNRKNKKIIKKLITITMRFKSRSKFWYNLFLKNL